MSDKTPVRFTDLFRYYRGTPHQLAALQELGELIPASLLHKSNNWYRTWTQDGKQPDPDWLWPALSLIREFEGCKLKAYRCPAGVWTIGWGSTRLIDRAVQEGDEISQTEADELLRWEVEKTAREVFRIFPEAKQWAGNRIGALISFVYNVGSGAAEGSTLRKRFAAGEDPNQVVAEELPRWNKANGQELAGLTRRRAAEVELFVGKQLQQPSYGNPLNVPFYAQMDSATDQGRRMCFSSSCAMLLAFLKPAALLGANGDDQYLKRVQQYGDTTDPAAQIKALSSYGIKARFVTNATVSMLEQQISKGIPVPCGYLHRGPVAKPSGGGHWLCVVGHNASHVIVHDPFGEADLLNGTTLSAVARYARYSRKNWIPRWCVEGPQSGWAIIAER